jgi:hypothetical protein
MSPGGKPLCSLLITKKMKKHEDKYCPRCSGHFECKVGSVLLCQCYAVKLNQEERDHMSGLYSDCLCASCMKEVKRDFHNRRFREKLKKILGVFYSE